MQRTDSMNRVKAQAKELAAGYAIGAANIIPGVSGGTFLLIFGLYERVIAILNGLKGDMLKKLLGQLLSQLKAPLNKERWGESAALLRESGLLFLGKLLLGAGLAIFSLSALMEYLLEHQHSHTYALFFGLIAASVLVPFKLMKKAKLLHILPFVIGTAVTIFVASAVNPADKLQEKSTQYAERLALEQNAPTTVDETVKPSRFVFKKEYDLPELLFAGVAGAVAISAMVLPGLSGSLVLILLGQYGAVLMAINGLSRGLKNGTLQFDQVLFLSTMSIGMALGIILFVKLIDFVFKRFHDGTMAFLTGLITGSLFALWPFKVVTTLTDIYEKIDGEIALTASKVVYTNSNRLPAGVSEALVALLFVGVGVAVMIPFLKSEGAESEQ